MQNIYFSYLYNYEHRPGVYVPSHTHNIYEMVFYNVGRGKSRTTKGDFEFFPSQCILYAPLVEHDETHDSFTNVDCIGFYLEDNILPTMHLSDSAEELFSLKRRLCNELRDRKANYSDMANFIVGEIAVQLLRRSNIVSDYQPVSCVSYATKFIDENFYNDIDIKKLAMIQGYSYEHFRHMFKTHCGISPKQYLIRKRLEYAAHLLTTTDAAVQDVAIQSGFDNLSMFSFIFKKHLADSPSEYRKKFLLSSKNSLP